MKVREMRPLRDRVWERVERGDGCWLWTGARTSEGYGQICHGRRGQHRTLLVHRLVYQWECGPIPDGLQLDHLCRVRHCVNPAHLEAVTPRENTMRSEALSARNARKTHCKRGHPFDETNTYRWRGRRSCRLCAKIHNRASYHRRKVEGGRDGARS